MLKDRLTKQFWLSIGIVFGSMVIAALALNYFSGDLDTQSKEINLARGEVQKQTAAVANLANLKAQAPQAEQYQVTINGLIPDQYGLVAFPQWFSKMGNQYGVTASASLGGVTSAATAGTPGLASFTFSIEGPSNLVPSFLDFMTTKAQGYLLTINTLDVAADGNNYKATGQGTLFTR